MQSQRKEDSVAYFNSVSSRNNTTLNRLLEGVFTDSREAQLDEFIQIERTLETEESETLTSEPTLTSNKKGQGSNKPPTVPTLNSDKQSAALNLNLKPNSSAKDLTPGIQSPSVQDLQGEFNAFLNDEQEKEHILLQSTLEIATDKSQTPRDGQNGEDSKPVQLDA